METTMVPLKVGYEAVTGDDAARVAAFRATLPHQRVYASMEEAALRFGLPMTGQEIHDRVRWTLRPRWHLPFNARIGVAVLGLLAAVFLGALAPWAWSRWMFNPGSIDAGCVHSVCPERAERRIESFVATESRQQVGNELT